MDWLNWDEEESGEVGIVITAGSNERFFFFFSVNESYIQVWNEGSDKEGEK